MPTLRELLDNCEPERLPTYEYAAHAAAETLGLTAANLIRWDTNETDHGNYGERLYGSITADDATVRVFYESAGQPGDHDIFLSVPCAADPNCELGAEELHDVRGAIGYHEDPTPGIDAFCPAHP